MTTTPPPTRPPVQIVRDILDLQRQDLLALEDLDIVAARLERIAEEIRTLDPNAQWSRWSRWQCDFLRRELEAARENQKRRTSERTN
jgi:hypothetical protein